MRKTWIVVITVLLAVAIIGGYAILDNIFPKAKTINCPATESIATITLIENNENSLVVDQTDIGEIVKNITDAIPTRAMSVNDYPTAKTYYTIEVDTDTRQYRYLLYAENSQVYVELPYEGIYKSNQQFLDFIEEYFKD